MERPQKPLVSEETLEMLRAACADAMPSALIAMNAALLANQRRTDEASPVFRHIAGTSTDSRLLFAAFQFCFRTGDLERAALACERRIELAERDGDHAQLARACTNLGLVHLTAARHAEALRFCTRAVEIDQPGGDSFALARDLGNLANVHEAMGDLDVAETLNLRALDVARRIGADEIEAGRHANLGDIALARGARVAARERWTLAAAMFRSLNQPYVEDELANKLRSLGSPARE